MVKLDTAKRAELCRRILNGELAACGELAEVYRVAGYVSLSVPLVRAAEGDSYSAGYSAHHALTVLGFSHAGRCPCYSCSQR